MKRMTRDNTRIRREVFLKCGDLRSFARRLAADYGIEFGAGTVDGDYAGDVLGFDAIEDVVAGARDVVAVEEDGDVGPLSEVLAWAWWGRVDGRTFIFLFQALEFGFLVAGVDSMSSVLVHLNLISSPSRSPARKFDILTHFHPAFAILSAYNFPISPIPIIPTDTLSSGCAISDMRTLCM